MLKHNLRAFRARLMARRRGSATLWMVIWLPCLLVLFCVLVGVANLWLARVELENALEASALAAVKQWGDTGGGDTLVPRQVGVLYAYANSVRRNPAVISTNYNPAGGPNQNDQCQVGMVPPTGNLIFGAIDDSNPDNIIFNAGVRPSCAGGLVVLDVTSNGELNDNENEWGIAFHPSAAMPAGLRINYVIITLPPNHGVVSFDPDFTLSPNDPGQFLVRDNSGYKQPDVFGFTNPAAQVSASYPTPLQLRIDFSADPLGGDLGFQPCDRIRFGNNVNFTNGANGLHGDLRDADGIGSIGATFTVGFSDGSVVTGVFSDNTHSKNACYNPGKLSSVGCPADGMGTPKRYVHPTNVDDIPCPAASAPDNNGQSLGFAAAAGNQKFGVRAQAMIPVQPLGGAPFVGTLTEYCVQAKTTAEYDCATRRVKLIRIDTFICPGP